MCPKDTDMRKKGNKNKAKISFFGIFWHFLDLFLDQFFLCKGVIAMAIILQPIAIRKCNINTLTYHFPATQGRSVKGLFYLEFRSILFFLNTRNMVFYYQ